MKRRKPEPVTVSPEGVPLALLAGACLEVWADDSDADHPLELHRVCAARNRYRDARRDWLAERGVAVGDPTPEVLRGVPTKPWSFEFLAERDPDHLADLLQSRGLPPDWTPADTPRPTIPTTEGRNTP